MKKKKIIKLIISFLILIVIFVSLFMIYKNLFAGSNSTRYDGIENYKLTNDEINSAKDVLEGIENVKDIDIFVNSLIIRIIIELEADTDFEQVKSVSNQILSSFSEENLKFYDMEIYVESMNDESEVYPQIGYKHKTNSEFSW